MKYAPMLLFAVLVSSCAPLSQPAQNISFLTLLQGVHPQNPFERGEMVITEAKTWHDFQQAAVSQVAPYPPTIDFSKEMVVAVLYGEALSGGYAIAIHRVTESQDDVVVHVREEGPGTGCFTTQALTYPYHVIRLAATEKKVVFEREKTTYSC